MLQLVRLIDDKTQLLLPLIRDETVATGCLRHELIEEDASVSFCQCTAYNQLVYFLTLMRMVHAWVAYVLSIITMIAIVF